MKYLRLWLAGVWLIFAAVTPAHAAAMTHPACDRMIMPHMPIRHMPAHDEGPMPCCSVPAVVAAEAQILQPGRRASFITLTPAPARRLEGLTPGFEPRPPKKSEA